MEFWSDERVVVTGGDSFLGRHLVRKLRDCGRKEIVVPRIEEVDLRERDDIVRVLQKAKPDMVIHLAASVLMVSQIQIQNQPARLRRDNLRLGLPVA
ncbi:MAG: NAD-dependent epimerase/dehydratase family protein [Acidobacteriia bacterium]|nr:NAD-dependent epimerase/dehydratase family protein [Terriglobia bacterium]